MHIDCFDYFNGSENTTQISYTQACIVLFHINAFQSETGEAERRAMRGWTGKLKCKTFKSRRGKSLCVPYKKLLRYAQGKQQQ